MDNVRIPKTKLLSILRNNRKKHRAIFEEALEGYRRAVTAELEQALADARAKKRFLRVSSFVAPTDQTSEYDRAIRMLELSSDRSIRLSEEDFAHYVMDKWEWSLAFENNVATYLRKPMR